MTELENKLIELKYAVLQESNDSIVYYKNGCLKRKICIVVNKKKTKIIMTNFVRCKENKKILKSDLEEIKKCLI